MVFTQTFTNITRLGVIALVLASCQDAQSPAETKTPAAEMNAEQPVIADTDMSAVDMAGDVSEAEKSALELFAYQEGTWDSVWKLYDALGNQTSTMEGIQSFAYLVDRHSQLMTTIIPGMHHTSYAVRGFNAKDGEIISLNMGAKGDYWSMRQDPVTGITLSDLHVNADGSTTIRRFMRTVATDDIYGITMEISQDNGQTWVKRYDQKLTRQKDE